MDEELPSIFTIVVKGDRDNAVQACEGRGLPIASDKVTCVDDETIIRVCAEDHQLMAWISEIPRAPPFDLGSLLSFTGPIDGQN